jgi:IclR family KDG regulon transcriptional repressor
MSPDTPPMKSIQRAFEIVHVLWELRGAGPSEIATQLDLSKSTAHVYLRSLQSTGYVVNHDGEYRLSCRFLTMGSRLKYRSRIFQVSKSEMRNLARETGELVTLLIEEAGKSVILHQEAGEQSLELGMHPGMTIPLHSHASGKLFLAYMTQDRIDEIIEGHELEQMTEYTITDRESLLAELDQIRENGYAFDWDQQVKGMGLIALPIIVDEELKAVLAVACPSGRIKDDSYREELLQKLQGTVDTLTIKYQYGT